MVKKRLSEIEMLEKEVLRGNTQALYNIGFMYLVGEDVAKDEAKAVQYFKKGCAHQDGRCMQALAMCYRYGDGVAKDENKTLYWLKAGTKINDPGCMYHYALALLAKDENSEEAIALMNKSADKKNKDAKEWLKLHGYRKKSWLDGLWRKRG